MAGLSRTSCDPDTGATRVSLPTQRRRLLVWLRPWHSGPARTGRRPQPFL